MSTTSPTHTPLGRWYALAVTAGRERKVAERIHDRLQRAGLLTADMRLVCPDEEVIVNAGTKDREVTRRVTLPGYLLVHTRRLSDGAVVTIKRVNGVMGFLGGDETPHPLGQAEVNRILGIQENAPGAKKTARRSEFEAGMLVTITDGPFTDFNGTVESVDESKQRATVTAELFGRPTPVQVSIGHLRRA